MMLPDSTAKRSFLRRICPPCTIIACAIASLLPTGAVTQVVGDPPVLAPGLHALTLPRSEEPAIHYAMYIPGSYSPSTPVPLILALHFGVRGADADGAGGDVVQILV